MDWLTNPESWIAFFTLLSLEIVLGVDNVIFIAILAGKLPAAQQNKARLVGLALAMFMRIGLLFSISWVMSLKSRLFTLWEHDVSGRDIVLIVGGLFLIGKATFEIHGKLEGAGDHRSAKPAASFTSVIIQVILLDIVFSLDSVITAVGMAKDIGVMVAAVVGAVLFMMAFAGPVSRFVEKHPTFKMLALSFLLLIGFTLVADGLGQHIPKGYIYFAMGFSLFVEVLNLKLRPKSTPVQFHEPQAKTS
jgi:predicted tellurium resistance membrane protein TerC